MSTYTLSQSLGVAAEFNYDINNLVHRPDNEGDTQDQPQHSTQSTFTEGQMERSESVVMQYV